MRSWTICSRRAEIKAAHVAAGCAVLFMVAGVRPALAQKSIQERYDHAMDLYNHGKLPDEACEILTQISKEKRHYKDVDTLHGPACTGAELVQDAELTLFNNGHKELTQQLYLQAEQDLNNALQKSNLLSKPRFKEAIARDLDRIRDWKVSDTQPYQQCRDLYNQGKLQDAISACGQAAAIHGPNAESADNLASKARAKQQQAQLEQNEREQNSSKRFSECENLEGQNKIDDAIECFKEVAQAKGSKSSEAQQRADDLSQQKHITEQQAQQQQPQVRHPQEAKNITPPTPVDTSRATPVKPAPAKLPPAPPPLPSRGEDRLREGIVAFVDGDYSRSDRSLSAYLADGGENKSLAYFFRGAARGTSYFLSGEKDPKSRAQAIEDFRKAKQAQGPHLPVQKIEKVVAPKILQLFRDAA